MCIDTYRKLAIYLKNKVKTFFHPDNFSSELIDMVGVGFSTKIPCGLYNNTASKIIPSNKKSRQTTKV